MTSVKKWQNRLIIILIMNKGAISDPLNAIFTFRKIVPSFHSQAEEMNESNNKQIPCSGNVARFDDHAFMRYGGGWTNARLGKPGAI